MDREATLLTPFGDQMRLLRLERRWSQERLGEKIGATANYVGEIERGKRAINIRTILRIARALDVPPARLFDRFDKPA